MRQLVQSGSYDVPLDGFTQALRFSLSGTLGFVSAVGGNRGDVAEQARDAVQRLRDQLAGAGLGYESVVQIRSYVRDIEEWPLIRPALRAAWPHTLPTSTAVEVPALADSEARLAIEATVTG